jgi:Uma2 family endonuclease
MATETTSAVDAVHSWLESGAWDEAAYLALPESNHFVELSNGNLVIPDMPSLAHQEAAGALFLNLQLWNRQHHAGRAIIAPYPVRLWPGKIREPDIVFYLNEHLDRLGDQVGGPPDLAVEVLSPSTRDTDLEEKLAEYAAAGVREYWIVDPDSRRVEVHELDGKQFRRIGRYGPGDEVTSRLLQGFSVAVDALFAR